MQSTCEIKVIEIVGRSKMKSPANVVRMKEELLTRRVLESCVEGGTFRAKLHSK